jgi:peptide/nickel transport system permease protein
VTGATAADRAPVTEAPAADRAPWRITLSVLLRNRLAAGGLAVLLLVLVAAVFGGTLAPHSPTATDILGRLQPPSGSHLFGTDELGRDVFSRTLVAARVSLRVGVIAVGISLALGVTVGLLAGYYGRWIDDVLMRVMDMLFAFPAILLAIAILAVLGPGVTNAMLAIGIVYTPLFARVTRAAVLSVREEVYIRATRSLGAGDARIIVRHVLPNVAGPIIVQASLSLAFAILSEAALSFLGLGVQPPAPSWGRMLYDARGFVAQAWWMGLFPGLAIFLTVLSFNVVGDGLRDALDPRHRTAADAR